MGQLIRDGVQDFTQIADHVEPSGDQPIHNIGDPGENQDASRQDIPVFPQIEPENDRDQAQAEKGEDIGNGDDFIRRPILLNLILILHG